MKAWQFVGPGQPLTLNEVEIPAPGPQDVLVRVLGTGLCHTDVAFVDGGIPSSFMAHVPMTVGHEVAGRVVAVGQRVTKVAVGDRVGVRSSTEGAGWAHHGGFAEYMAAREEHTVKAPDGVSYSYLAVGGDAGMTAYSALTRGGVGPDVRVGIIGLGGLGCSGLQMAVRMGAVVYGAEPRTMIHDMALRWGAAGVFSSAEGFKELDLDVIVDYAGFATTVSTAVEAVGFGGTVVLVGAGEFSSTVNTMMMVRNKVSLLGHQGATDEDLLTYWDFVRQGLEPVVTEIAFDEIADGLDRLRRNEVVGRLVAVLPDE